LEKKEEVSLIGSQHILVDRKKGGWDTRVVKKSPLGARTISGQKKKNRGESEGGGGGRVRWLVGGREPLSKKESVT